MDIVKRIRRALGLGRAGREVCHGAMAVVQHDTLKGAVEMGGDTGGFHDAGGQAGGNATC